MQELEDRMTGRANWTKWEEKSVDWMKSRKLSDLIVAWKEAFKDLEWVAQAALATMAPFVSYGKPVNSGVNALLRDGYYEVNGIKFSEYYYNKLWNTGRGGSSLVVPQLHENNGGKGITITSKPGFFRYTANGWEMVYNPTTKEVWHIQPKR
jgi:hypothetical protein